MVTQETDLSGDLTSWGSCVVFHPRVCTTVSRGGGTVQGREGEGCENVSCGRKTELLRKEERGEERK